MDRQAPNDDVPAVSASYEEAIRFCVDGILRLHWGEKLINKIFGRATQSHAAGLAIVMHYEALEGRGCRPTLSRIQAAMGKARTLAAFFALLRLAGLIRVEVDPADRRIRYLVPTPLLIEGLKGWMLQHVRCGEIMGLIEPGFAERARGDEALFAAFVARARPVIERTRTPPDAAAAWTWIDSLDCGDRIGLLLLRGHYAAAQAGEEWFAFDSRDAAENLGISHSHVRNVLNRAEAKGLLRQDRRGHGIALSPRFVGEARAWFTAFWGWVAATAQATRADAAASAASRNPGRAGPLH
ncbi:hypothetical protein [Microvirga thermotolerans]|uniref:Uncharacterized protein n=1 Tax=Microvirga thermotolerans TaxID=2651334 RepID=A0A5P9JS54_9HYPH|nr:hypothetical protein [Microvirga thermotolerans]QFU14909.1 hypothetical protein GDR74_01035 [Microvirga thermotolerans]